MAEQVRTTSISTWNLAWAPPSSNKLGTMMNRLKAHEPDVVCFTEAHTDGILEAGYAISGEADWGYDSDPNARKVILWSKSPWQNVDQIGDRGLPSGRFVSGTTETPLGLVNVIGVCIPWRDAHVRTGRCDREPWQDHLAYLDVLQGIISDSSSKTVLLGDFNQRVPRRWTPERVHQRLLDAIKERLKIVTSGLLQPIGAQTIDHLAVSSDLEAKSIETISNVADDGKKLSDHFGVTAVLSMKP